MDKDPIDRYIIVILKLLFPLLWAFFVILESAILLTFWGCLAILINYRNPSYSIFTYFNL